MAYDTWGPIEPLMGKMTLVGRAELGSSLADRELTRRQQFSWSFRSRFCPPIELHVPYGRIDSDLPKDGLQSSDAPASDSQAKRLRR